MNSLLIFALVLNEFNKPIYKLAVNQELFRGNINIIDKNINICDIKETNSKIHEYLLGYMDCFTKYNNTIYKKGFQWDWITIKSNDDPFMHEDVPIIILE